MKKVNYPLNMWFNRRLTDNIKQFFRNIKARHKRGKDGFAPEDTWNLDYNMALYISETLKYLANNTHGYPGNNKFPTYESWQNYLLDLSNRFKELQNWGDWIEQEKNTSDYKIIRDKLDIKVSECFNDLAKIFCNLWD